MAPFLSGLAGDTVLLGKTNMFTFSLPSETPVPLGLNSPGDTSRSLGNNSTVGRRSWGNNSTLGCRSGENNSTVGCMSWENNSTVGGKSWENSSTVRCRSWQQPHARLRVMGEQLHSRT